MQIKNTRRYELFKLREDNRCRIIRKHVEDLKEKIKKKNLLHLNPIVVNINFEIINGQHRFLAAKELGVDIHYLIDASLTPMDILDMNTSQTWKMSDILNFYVKNGNKEYIALDAFLKETDVGLRAALYISIGRCRKDLQAFKNGEYVFNLGEKKEVFQLVSESIATILFHRPSADFIKSGLASKGMWGLFCQKSFDRSRWFRNLERFVDRLRPCATQTDYLKMFTQFYNWRLAKNKSDF